MTTLIDVLDARLRQLGVLRVYGSPLGGLDHVDVVDPDTAVLLADADGRLGHVDGSGRLGAAFIDGPILHLSSKPGGTSVLERVTSPADLFDVLADPPGMEIPGTLALNLDLDLSQPCTLADSERGSARGPVITLDPAMASLRIVLLVGVGVVRAGAVAAARELARHAGWGVVNTWGARGIERWDSPFDFGTVGLQERDVELSGLVDADVIVTSGVDPDEFDPALLATKLVQDVPPRQLSALLGGWRATKQLPTRSGQHEALSKVLVPMYESDAVPLTPPRAALHLAGALPEGGVTVGTPGSAGFWLARAYPTSAPESLCLPATSEPGFVAAAALVCALEQRPYLAVMDQPVDGPDGLDETTRTIMSLAERLDVPLTVQLWGSAGAESMASTADHVELTMASLEISGHGPVAVPVDTGSVAGLIDIAGRPIMLGGPEGRPFLSTAAVDADTGADDAADVGR